MTTEQIVQWRLAGHHLLEPSEVETVVKDLCGLQAQFLSHALYGLQIRCGSVSTDGLIKSWTNRGTMHIFSQSDLPLFFHKGRTHFLRPVDSMDTDAFITAKRKAYFADLILTSVAAGICQRDALKAVCMEAGLTEGVLRRGVELAEKRGCSYHVGNLLSTDVFYNDHPESNRGWQKMGVLAVEMEAAALYMNAARAGKRALAICTVSDSLVTGEALPAEERQTSFGEMIELALDLAVTETQA